MTKHAEKKYAHFQTEDNDKVMRHCSTKNLKKPMLMLFLAVILMNAAMGFAVHAQEDIQNTYTAAVLRDFPPLYKLENDGTPEGFAIDILENVAAIAGFSVNYVIAENWDEAAAMVADGRADFVPAFGIMDERSDDFIFSNAVETIPVSIFVRSESMDITDINSLSGRRTAVMIGGAAELEIGNRYPNVKLASFENIDTALVQLLAGGVDAFIFPKPVLEQKARDINVSNQIKTVGEPLMELKRGFMLRQEDEALQKVINDAIDQYTATDQYIAAFNRWYGEPDPYWTTEMVARAAAGALVGLTLLFAAIYLANRKKYSEEIVVNQEKLRMSEEKLQALFTSMTDMVVIHQAVYDENQQMTNYQILDCNRSYTKVTGISREMAEGKLATEVYGTDVAPYAAEFERVVNTGKPYQFETYFAPMEKHFSVSAVSLGQHRFATVSADITESRKAQQEIAAKNKELEQILYVASHDLRSPLVNVDGYSREMVYELEDIKEAFEHATDEEGSKYLHELMVRSLPELMESLGYIRASVRQMDKLLKGLLKLSRLGRAALTIVPLDMNDLVKRAVDAAEYQLKQVGIKVEVGDLPPCRGDEVQVTQAFSNLLDNALKYRDPAKQGMIRITGTSDNDTSTYCVEDNGIGIAKEHQQRIFELFHRLNPRENEGEGLGLTTVQQIIERLGGNIYVTSALGEGSEFYVQLPIAAKGAVK